jgi:hypothetical protein
MQDCNKEIKEAQFVPLDAMMMAPTGPVKVKLFVCICPECIVKKGLTERAVGGAKVD